MKPIPQQIESLLMDALQAAQDSGALPEFPLPVGIPISPPKRPEHGDYATSIALALVKLLGRRPLEIATAIQQHLPANDLISSAEAVAPGYVNLRLNENWIRAQVETIVREGGAAFRQDFGAGKRAQVEFVSANPTGPLHIGRTRGAILGDSLANLLTECGFAVEREYYFNNAGRQMEILGKSLQARYLQALGLPAVLPDEAYQGDYLIEIGVQLKREVGDAWKDRDWEAFKQYAEAEIFRRITATLKRVNVVHDYFFNEQSVYDDGSVWEVLEQLKAAGYAYEAVWREGASEEEIAKAKAENSGKAIWFRSTAFHDTEDRVLVKANGDPTYALPDIAYHINKLERGFDRLLNVLGSDHLHEAQTVRRGLEALGYDTSRLHVVFHQFVTFGELGRMSTRAGNYVTLDDLIDEVGADAVRYFMLARSPNSHFEFDFELAKQQSRENPVYYIQNAHVRCCGIFRQVAERGLPDNWDEGADLSKLGAAELTFVRKMLELPEQIALAYKELAPHQIAFYALDLARSFHPLYEEVRVLSSEVPEEVARARLRFYRAAQITFAYVLKLMGMSAPERM